MHSDLWDNIEQANVLVILESQKEKENRRQKYIFPNLTKTINQETQLTPLIVRKILKVARRN